MSIPLELLIFLLAGAFTGILSGLLGVGGGLVIVPILLLLLGHHQVPPSQLMHVALATSLATIIFTSLSSARAHASHGNIHWGAVRHITPGVIAGALMGAWLAAGLPTITLKIVFVVFVFYVGTQLLLDFRPPASRTLPGRLALFTVGSVVGIFSSLVGIGGGTMTVPFLVYCNCHMRQAVGTSSVVGFPIAVAGTLGFIINGWHIDGLPPYSAGFVYLPAVAGISMASMMTAPIGARLAQTLPVSSLKKIFAVLLFVIGIKMLLSLN